LIDKNKILLISGSGQNIGKTTFVCNIISKNKGKDIVAIKISPHFHKVETAKLLFSENDYQIYQELDKTGSKDSNKMLNAGAKQVFYIQAKDESLNSAYHKLSELIDNETYIICESGALRDIIKPRAFIFIKNIDEDKIKEKSKHLIPLADGVLIFNGEKHIWEKRPDIDFKINIT